MSDQAQNIRGLDGIKTYEALLEVGSERAVQRGRWGNAYDDTLNRDYWNTILTTYVGYVSRAVLEMGRITPSEEAKLRAIDNYGLSLMLRSQLIKVAATAVAWVEALDRREARSAELETGRP